MEIYCIHCGDECLSDKIIFENKNFCCTGCKTVFQILSEQGLDNYYNIENTPGISKKNKAIKNFDFLENEKVKEEIYEFSDGNISRVRIYLPSIHCSSCIWLLENLHKLSPGIIQSRVNFTKKQASIVFKESKIGLKDLLILLDKIGYTPDLVNSIENKKKKSQNNKSSNALLYKIGIAGFSFGNIMLSSFPEYLDTLGEITPAFEKLFRYSSFIFSLPIILYCSTDYFKSAYKSIRSKFLNIDVPISIGIITLFLRSTIDVFVFENGGYFDSLAGLVFFLLIGKWFQDKTYNALSFDRDFKSFFPLAFKIEKNNKQIFKTLDEIEVDDIAIIRNTEVIPADGLLLNQTATIDYSFVTGESVPVSVQQNDQVFAGGQIIGASSKIKIQKEVSNSYLINLWNESDTKSGAHQKLLNTIDLISQKFTIAVLIIAFLSAIFWSYKLNWGASLDIFTAVLIVACPCALALAAPFTFGHAIRYLGKKDIFFKNTNVIEKLTNISTLVFDKTGTLTNSSQAEIEFLQQDENKEMDFARLKKITQNSTHPLSKLIAIHFDSYHSNTELDTFEEIVGKGIKSKINNQEYLLGSYSFLKEQGIKLELSEKRTPKVYLAIENVYMGVFLFHNKYRPNIFKEIQDLKENYKIIILSGDDDYEREKLEKEISKDVKMFFNQTPFDKRSVIENLQKNGETVAMFGDGLNDAGALEQADAGVSIIENIGSFSPASDIILKSNRIKEINNLFQFSKSSLKLLKWSLLFSLFYNTIGMSFAILGKLTPLVAAILMPLSSISVVAFVTIGIFILSKKHMLN